MAETKSPYKQVRIEDLITDARQREALADLSEAWEPEKVRLETASKLAVGLMALFGFVVASSGIVTLILSIVCATGSGGNPEDGIQYMRDFFNMLLPYIATPLGIALGYFFRESSN